MAGLHRRPADLDRVRGAVRLAATGGAGGGDGRARVRARQLRRDRAVRSAWALSGMRRPAPALANACWGGRTWPLGIDWRTTMQIGRASCRERVCQYV